MLGALRWQAFDDLVAHMRVHGCDIGYKRKTVFGTVFNKVMKDAIELGLITPTWEPIGLGTSTVYQLCDKCNEPLIGYMYSCTPQTHSFCVDVSNVAK